MTDAELEALGEVIAAAIAQLAGRQPAPAPSVNVAVPDVVVDPAPIAQAMAESGRANADAVATAMREGNVLLAQAVVKAGASVRPAEMGGLSSAVAEVAKAVSALRVEPDLRPLIEAINRNTAAQVRVADAIQEQTDILARPRSVVTDSGGRVVGVKVG